MEPFYELKVLTPKGAVYAGQVIHALVPAEDGFIGVLANHAPYVSSSSGGRFEVRERNDHLIKFRAGAGFFEVANNQATFFTQTWEPL
ncbi:MAG: F0F1 ATP synthase subunit epsilon [Candidatus Omnitrophica bacterium]|nr:F0F1 ATP synthase subunit epsilon [Candidatus Omnitrophota bacterium]